MEVILLEKSRRGNIGDIIKVAGGYGRNFLIPKGKAVRATEENKTEVAKKREALELANREAFEAAAAIAQQLGQVILDLVREASEDMKLYGSVYGKDIVEEIKKIYGLEIDHTFIHIPNRIKEVKTYDDITIKLHHDVIVPVVVNIKRHEEKK